MNRNAIDFSARMQEGRDLAQVARNRGLPTGKAAKGWNVSKRPDPPAGSWDRLAATVTAAWRFDRDEAIEAFRFAVYPERYEAIEL